MLDDTLPLTVAEWDEWGDPREPEHYAYLRGYSPYDNLPGPAAPGDARDRQPARPAGQRPRAGQVGGEDAGRRQTRATAELLLLQTALGGAAHTGPAGRYDAWRHEALLHAFVLDQLTLTPAPGIHHVQQASATSALGGADVRPSARLVVGWSP